MWSRKKPFACRVATPMRRNQGEHFMPGANRLVKRERFG
jgi:hypothetical protein